MVWRLLRGCSCARENLTQPIRERRPREHFVDAGLPRGGNRLGLNVGDVAQRPYPFELGVLFQIVDDILDVTGSDEQLGKPSGSDERHGKLTYVSLFGLERARELAAESHAQAMSGGGTPCFPLGVKAFLARNGGVARVRYIIGSIN